MSSSTYKFSASLCFLTLLAACWSYGAQANGFAADPPVMSFPGGGMTGSATTAGSVAQQALPYRTIAVQPAFRHTVVEIMDWSCPHCREVNDGAISWGKSLPHGWVFIQTPVVLNQADARSSAVFAAIEQTAGDHLASFDDTVFSSVQDSNRDPDDPQTMMQAAQSTGIDYAAFRSQNTASGIRRTVAERLALLQAVAPTRTPTFVVDGRFVTDVSFTGERYDLLFSLLGGLVSQQIGR